MTDIEAGGGRGPEGTRRKLEDVFRRLEEHRPAKSRYRVGREIARGGMGQIVEAFDEDLRSELVLKRIRDEELPEDRAEQVIQRFVEEAQVTAQLDHPGVVAVHELGLDSEGRVFFSMARVRGRDLEGLLPSVLEERDGWNRTRLVGVLLRVCETMAYAHAKGVLHRDLKPANVMVGEFGEVYVMDWGLAKLVESGDGEGETERSELTPVRTDRDESAGALDGEWLVTRPGSVMGTPAYMPPEQALGMIADLDERSDVYSVGAILYTFLAGRPPYAEQAARGGVGAVMAELVARPPTPIERLAPDVPPELVAICERAMAREPAARYPSMEALAEDLRAFLENRVVRAYRTGPWVEFQKWVARNRGMAASLLGLVLAVVAGLGGVGLSQAAGRRKAEIQRDRVLRLSDVKVARELLEREPTTWPALPANRGAITAWASDAEALLGREPDHRMAREELEAAAHEPPEGSAAPVFERPEDAWQYQVLTELLGELEELPRRLEGVRGRAALADELEYRTRTGPAAQLAWGEAIESIADPDRCPAYHGLRIAPQLGLLPLGRNARTGLWEFWHVLSGEKPRWDAERERWIPAEGGGLVLVLLPGGTATVGAWSESDAHPRGEPFVDPLQGEIDNDEGPPTKVDLDPFFVSAYELTRDQFARTGLSDESKTWPELGEDRLRPVQTVTWTEAREALRRLDLELPTEAQWEYACRAGTTTPFSCGSEPADLAGYANVADLSFARAGLSNGGFEERGFDDGVITAARVGSFRPNPFGLYDMHGNVWEWCLDDYHARVERRRPGDGLAEPLTDAVEGTIRGGSWFGGGRDARAANRFHYGRGGADADLGLRPVRRLEAD